MRKYPKYKESGIQWLGAIPNDWAIIRGSGVFVVNRTNIRVKAFENINVFHYSIPNVQEYGNGKIEEGNSLDSDKLLLKGNELLVSKLNPAKRTIILAEPNELPILASGEFVPIIARKCDRKFAFYLYLSHITSERICSTVQSVTNSHQRAKSDTVWKLWNAFPLLQEQQSIVRFLDYKTGQIDSFIANRQKQIELLKEQKISIINFAITRGINKNIKLKKSETLTLDYYPEHWKLTKIKYLLKQRRAAIRTGPFGTQLKNSDLKEDGEIKIYNQRSVIDKNFINGTEYISLEKFEGLKDFVVNPNDLLITTRGTIGKCAVFPENMEVGVLHPCLIRMQLDERIISNDYAMICLENALYFQEEIKLLSNSTVIEVIYSYNLKEVFLPTPPIEEQKDILNHIAVETSTINTLISKYQKQIDLMQEYRTSLISQAVTGKIDVREWQPKKQQTA